MMCGAYQLWISRAVIRHKADVLLNINNVGPFFLFADPGSICAHLRTIERYGLDGRISANFNC